MLDNMEYGGGGGAFPPFADPGPLFCVASKQNRRCTTGSFGSVRLSVKLSILDTRRRKRVTAVHLLRHRPSWYPSLETATSQTQAEPLIVFCAGVTKKQLDEVMLTLDKNGDGEIKFDEFAEW